MTVYQHYRTEEHPFIDQVLSWREMVERDFVRKITDFLNPREQTIISQIIGETNEDLQLKFFGGGSYTERVRAIIAPYYELIEDDDFQIVLLEAKYAEKFVNITHRDVMGSFLSLGIDRKILGDIFVENGVLQIVTTKDIAPYVLANLTSVKNANIQLQSAPLENLLEKKLNWRKMDKTVSSLRIDVVIKEMYNLSRNESAKIINQKNVHVNHKIVDDVKFSLEPGDLISVRGKGRGKLISMNGYSRKNRLRITIGTLK